MNRFRQTHLIIVKLPGKKTPPFPSDVAPRTAGCLRGARIKQTDAVAAPPAAAVDLSHAAFDLRHSGRHRRHRTSLLCHKNISFETRRKGNVRKEERRGRDRKKSSRRMNGVFFSLRKSESLKPLHLTDSSTSHALYANGRRRIWCAATTILFHETAALRTRYHSLFKTIDRID